MRTIKQLHKSFAKKIAIISKNLLSKPKNNGFKVIVVINGDHVHGGLTDRFRHIMSIYDYCKQRNYDFRIFYKYPCDITRILLPNKYDWRIHESAISYSWRDKKDVLIYSKFKSSKINKESEKKFQVEYLNKKISPYNNNTQYHVYGNSYFSEDNFKSLFEDLFKPSDKLTLMINSVAQKLPETYDSVVLRFQQLLGDFSEGSFKILDDREKEKLIHTCVEKIKSLYRGGYFTSKKILVTSDSSSFLNVIKTIEFVEIIPGKLVHMDFTIEGNDNIYMKSFVDLYLLSKSNNITLLKTGDMYNSGFPEFAANIGSAHFKIISF